MKPKLSLITLGVADIDRSLAFYRDGLGLPTHNYKPGDEMIFFAMEGTFLGLFPREELAKDAQVSAEGSGFRGVCIARNEPSKEAVDATFAEALAAGARLVKQPHDVFWGGYSGYFADPDGHLWEVAFNPLTDLT
jgi:catechol 2,3-dioxygenase-like lactoylglutathione lyase family enzyme